MFHRPLHDVPDPFPSFCSVYTDSTAYDWKQEITLRHSARRITVWPSGRIHTDYHDFTTTVAASEPSDMKEVGQSTSPLMLEREVSSNPFCVSGFQQQAAASRSQQQASSSVVSPWLTADLWSSTRKWVRGNESISSVEGTLSRGKRETDIWRVCKLSPEGEISMSTLNKKLKWLFKENAGMRSSEKII